MRLLGKNNLFTGAGLSILLNGTVKFMTIAELLKILQGIKNRQNETDPAPWYYDPEKARVYSGDIPERTTVFSGGEKKVDVENAELTCMLRNLCDTHLNEAINLLKEKRWRDASPESEDLPLPFTQVEISIMGIPAAGMIVSVPGGFPRSAVWVNIWNGENCEPEVWRPINKSKNRSRSNPKLSRGRKIKKSDTEPRR